MTPAIELLHQRKVSFTVHRYEHDPAVESYGEEAVKALDLKADQVFKTLMVQMNTGEWVVGVIPVSSTMNLKAIALAAEAKKAIMADRTKIQPTTGYVLGGVSPLAQRKALRTIIDSSATQLDTLFISGGKRGLDIELSPYDLAELCMAKFASIAKF